MTSRLQSKFNHDSRDQHQVINIVHTQPLNIPYMYVRQGIANKEIVLVLIGSEFNNADMGTKPLYFAAHKNCRDNCGYIIPYETSDHFNSVKSQTNR